ncbi:MAG: cell division protein FtsQ/DivIB [Chthonomonadales bacterium]
MALGAGRNSARQRAAAALHRERFPNAPGRSSASRKKRTFSPLAVRRLILGALWMVLAAEVLFALRRSPWFDVQHVQLEGVRTLAPSEVQALEAAVQLPAGTNLFYALFKWRGASAAKLPFVARVQVRPASVHGLRVLIRPRVPVAVVESGGNGWEVDSQGWVVRGARSNMSLPVIQVAGGLALRPGTVVADDAVLQVLRTVVPAAAGGLSVAKVHVDPQGNLCLNMLDGVEVQMGQPYELGAKLRLLERIYHEEPGIGRRVAAINLSCIEAPACTPRMPGRAQGAPENARDRKPQ